MTRDFQFMLTKNKIFSTGHFNLLSLKSNDGGRELIIETFKKRGIKFHADYAKIIECVTYHLTEKLSVFEKVEADISNLSLNSPDQLLCDWRRDNLAKISLRPLEEALGKQFQKWITDQDEQLMGQMKKNFKLQVHNGLLSRLSFVVKGFVLGIKLLTRLQALNNDSKMMTSIPKNIFYT